MMVLQALCGIMLLFLCELYWQNHWSISPSFPRSVLLDQARRPPSLCSSGRSV